MSGPIPNWAFSTLMRYETCAYRVKLQKIDKIKEPPRPPDNPLDRGNREHIIYQTFVDGTLIDLSGSTAKEIKKFTPLFEHAKELHACDLATTEQDWLFDSNWEVRVGHWTNACGYYRLEDFGGNPIPPEVVWHTSKLDLCAQDTEQKRVVVVDYKTGKSQYKAIEHVQQLQLYGAEAALRFEWADEIVAELWYVDEGHIRSMTFTRDQALSFVGRFQARADRLMNEKYWRPNPSAQTCRFCPYNSKGTGSCPTAAI